MMNIVLIGFMAAGKTAVGMRLAEELHMEFVDLDDLIAEQKGLSIADIFNRHGEAHFRELEREMVAQVSRRSFQVVATGGGVVLDPENVSNLKRMGRMIHLSARPEVILERVKNEDHRPLLETADREERIRKLLSQRAPFYAVADLEIDTSGLNVDEVVAEIVRHLQELSHG
jgi:shikimate kinase